MDGFKKNRNIIVPARAHATHDSFLFWGTGSASVFVVVALY